MSTEIEHNEDVGFLWDTCINAIKTRLIEQEHGISWHLGPQILGMDILPEPEDSANPISIDLHYVYYGDWRTVTRTLTFTGQAAEQLRYRNMHFNGDENEGFDSDITYGPGHPETVKWTATLVKDIRRSKIGTEI